MEMEQGVLTNLSMEEVIPIGGNRDLCVAIDVFKDNSSILSIVLRDASLFADQFIELVGYESIMDIDDMNDIMETMEEFKQTARLGIENIGKSIEDTLSQFEKQMRDRLINSEE